MRHVPADQGEAIKGKNYHHLIHVPKDEAAHCQSHVVKVTKM